MKIVHTSDWHIGRSLNGYRLLEDQAFFLKELTNFLVEQQVNVLIIAGDLYDRAVPSAQAVALLDEFLTDIVLKKQIKVFAIAGNHDSPERLSFSNQFLEQSGLYIQGNVLDGIKCVALGKVSFYMLPYIEPAMVRGLFPDREIHTYDQAVGAVFDAFIGNKLYNKLNNEINILISHGFYLNLGDVQEQSLVFSESELSVGGSDVVNAQRFSDFDYVALGHLHAPQNISDNMRYSGSPLKYSISEANQQKSIQLLEIDPQGKMHYSTHSLKLLNDLRVLEGLFEEVVQAPSEDYVFVNLTDREYLLDAIGRLRVSFPNILGLKYRNMQQAVDVESCAQAVKDKTPLDLFSDFYNSSTGESLSEDQIKFMSELICEMEVEHAHP